MTRKENNNQLIKLALVLLQAIGIDCYILQHLDAISDTAFTNEYGKMMTRVLLLDDRTTKITHTRLQQYHYIPFVLNEESKKVYFASIARKFLQRLTEMGFGFLSEIRKKKNVFVRHKWEDLNGFCKSTLSKLLITHSQWTALSTVASEALIL